MRIFKEKLRSIVRNEILLEYMRKINEADDFDSLLGTPDNPPDPPPAQQPEDVDDPATTTRPARGRSAERSGGRGRDPWRSGTDLWGDKTVEAVQTVLNAEPYSAGLTVDGKWGTNSNKAWTAAMAAKPDQVKDRPDDPAAAVAMLKGDADADADADAGSDGDVTDEERQAAETAEAKTIADKIKAAVEEMNSAEVGGLTQVSDTGEGDTGSQEEGLDINENAIIARLKRSGSNLDEDRFWMSDEEEEDMAAGAKAREDAAAANDAAAEAANKRALIPLLKPAIRIRRLIASLLEAISGAADEEAKAAARAKLSAIAAIVQEDGKNSIAGSLMKGAVVATYAGLPGTGDGLVDLAGQVTRAGLGGDVGSAEIAGRDTGQPQVAQAKTEVAKLKANAQSFWGRAAGRGEDSVDLDEQGNYEAMFDDAIAKAKELAATMTENVTAQAQRFGANVDAEPMDGTGMIVNAKNAATAGKTYLEDAAEEWNDAKDAFDWLKENGIDENNLDDDFTIPIADADPDNEDAPTEPTEEDILAARGEYAEMDFATQNITPWGTKIVEDEDVEDWVAKTTPSKVFINAANEATDKLSTGNGTSEWKAVLVQKEAAPSAQESVNEAPADEAPADEAPAEEAPAEEAPPGITDAQFSRIVGHLETISTSPVPSGE